MSASKYKFMNIALFQIGWFSCVLLPLQFATIITFILLSIHLYLIDDPVNESYIIAFVGCFGFSLDVLFSKLGFISFTTNSNIPFFLLYLWLLFAMTLRYSSKIFISTKLVCIITGLLAPFSYIGAQKLNKVEYINPMLESVTLHALLWCMLLLITRELFMRYELITNA